MRHRLLFVALISLAACSSSVSVPQLAPTGDPPTRKASGNPKLDLGSLGDDAVCSKPEGLEELCISGLRTAMEDGLGSVLAAQFDGSGDRYLARFRFGKFSHAQTDGGIAVSFAWRFTLVGQDGEPVLMLDEQTTGPEPYQPGADPAPAIGAALDAVLDNVAETMASTEL